MISLDKLPVFYTVKFMGGIQYLGSYGSNKHKNLGDDTLLESTRWDIR